MASAVTLADFAAKTIHNVKYTELWKTMSKVMPAVVSRAALKYRISVRREFQFVVEGVDLSFSDEFTTKKDITAAIQLCSSSFFMRTASETVRNIKVFKQLIISAVRQNQLSRGEDATMSGDSVKDWLKQKFLGWHANFESEGTSHTSVALAPKSQLLTGNVITDHIKKVGGMRLIANASAAVKELKEAMQRNTRIVDHAYRLFVTMLFNNGRGTFMRGESPLVLINPVVVHVHGKYLASMATECSVRGYVEPAPTFSLVEQIVLQAIMTEFKTTKDLYVEKPRDAISAACKRKLPEKFALWHRLKSMSANVASIKDVLLVDNSKNVDLAILLAKIDDYTECLFELQNRGALLRDVYQNALQKWLEAPTVAADIFREHEESEHRIDPTRKGDPVVHSKTLAQKITAERLIADVQKKDAYQQAMFLSELLQLNLHLFTMPLSRADGIHTNILKLCETRKIANEYVAKVVQSVDALAVAFIQANDQLKQFNALAQKLTSKVVEDNTLFSRFLFAHKHHQIPVIIAAKASLLHIPRNDTFGISELVDTSEAHKGVMCGHYLRDINVIQLLNGTVFEALSFESSSLLTGTWKNEKDDFTISPFNLHFVGHQKDQEGIVFLTDQFDVISRPAKFDAEIDVLDDKVDSPSAGVELVDGISVLGSVTVTPAMAIMSTAAPMHLPPSLAPMPAPSLSDAVAAARADIVSHHAAKTPEFAEADDFAKARVNLATNAAAAFHAAAVVYNARSDGGSRFRDKDGRAAANLALREAVHAMLYNV